MHVPLKIRRPVRRLISGVGVVAVAATALLALSSPANAATTSCSATYRLVATWSGGFQGEVTVLNTGGSTINGWNVSIALSGPATLTQAPNGNLVGNNPYTVTNTNWNAVLPPNGSTVFWVIGTGSPVVVSVGCSPAGPPTGTPVPTEPIPGMEGVKYYSGVLDERRVVIRDPATWADLWAELHRGRYVVPPVPAIDFETRMVLFVSFGQQTTGGYSIEIQSVYRDGGKVTAKVLQKYPGPDCIVTQALTQPTHAVTIPRLDVPVVFDVHHMMYSCKS